MNKQCNRGDMRKIHVTRQFFGASGRHGDFFKKTKNVFLDKVYESMCTKFQVCIVFRLTRRRDTNKYTNTQIHTYTSEIRNILDRLLASRGFWKQLYPLQRHRLESRLRMGIMKIRTVASFCWKKEVHATSIYSHSF